MSTWTDCHHRPTNTDEQRIYSHLLDRVQVESPSQLIDRFQRLFIDGIGYPESDILEALRHLTSARDAEQQFRFIVNRCCHILINRWQMHPHQQSAIPTLIELFANPTPRHLAHYPIYVRRLRDLVDQFRNSEQYLTLRRLADVMRESQLSAEAEQLPLGTLIRRYPYLYEHCLLSEDSTYEHQQTVRQIQAQVQRQFELDLSQYVTYRVRRSQIKRSQASQAAEAKMAIATAGKSSSLILPQQSRISTPPRALTPVTNPTLLSDQELGFAIKQFVGKVKDGHTYRDLANQFLTHTSQGQSFHTFKSDLYEYITTSVDRDYGKRQFNHQLCNHLKNTLPDSDGQRMNDFLMVRTCSNLLNFLVAEGQRNPNHFLFIDLITNIGPTVTTGILLKVVLICRKVKPYLERRFSILFNHYESCTHDAVLWLVQALENLNVALVTNFGAVDLSFVGQSAR